MSEVQLGFNAHNIQPQFAGSGGLPVGRHPVVIVNAETAPTKGNDGSGMLVLHLQAIDGPNKGGKQMLRLNLWNQSAQAAEIANKQLSAICHAVGVFDVPVASVLFNRPFMIDITQQVTNPQYTEISAIYDMNGNVPGSGQAGAPPSAPQQPAAPQQQGGFQPPQQQPQQGGFQPPAQQGGFQQPQQQGFQQPQQGGFQPPQQGGFQPPQQAQPQQGGFTPPGGPPAQAGGFQPPAQGGWAPR